MPAQLKIGENHLREVAELVGELDHKFRPDYPLTFSVSPTQEAWTFQTFGYTKAEERMTCTHPLLTLVCKEYLCLRSEGGRLHLNVYGAFFGEEKLHKQPFVTFLVDKHDHSALELITTNCNEGKLTWNLIQSRLGKH